MIPSAEGLYAPIVRELRRLNGKGVAFQVIDRIARERGIFRRSADYGIFVKRAHWGRDHLVRANLIELPEKSGYGLWELTAKGRRANLALFDPRSIQRNAQKRGRTKISSVAASKNQGRLKF